MRKGLGIRDEGRSDFRKLKCLPPSFFVHSPSPLTPRP